MSINEFKFPFVPDSSQSSPFNGSTGSSKRDSAITMMSVSDLSLHQSPSLRRKSQTSQNKKTPPNQTRQRPKSTHTKRLSLSATVKALFANHNDGNGNKKSQTTRSQSVHSTPRSRVDDKGDDDGFPNIDMKIKKRKKRKQRSIRPELLNGNTGINVRIRARSEMKRKSSNDCNENDTKPKRGSSGKIFKRLSFAKLTRNKDKDKEKEKGKDNDKRNDDHKKNTNKTDFDSKNGDIANTNTKTKRIKGNTENKGKTNEKRKLKEKEGLKIVMF